MPLQEALERRSFDAARLMAEHPPILRDANKRAVHEIACPRGCVHRGVVRYARWPASALPREVDVEAALSRTEAVEGFYDYAPVAGVDCAMEWHVYFADRDLFFGYGCSLFAQDEIQAAEHPALGALREALVVEGLPAVTVEASSATPVVVMGVERRCRVATEANAEQGRPEGLYGSAFARASVEAVHRATSKMEPPATSNLICIAAPAGGYGAYRASEIQSIQVTAFSGFRAAVLESAGDGDKLGQAVIHTGFWGCGAFGGNRVLMTLMQILAAELAQVHRLVFHVGARDGLRSFDEACLVARSHLAGKTPEVVADLPRRVAEWGLCWGTSDGN